MNDFLNSFCSPLRRNPPWHREIRSGIDPQSIDAIYTGHRHPTLALLVTKSDPSPVAPFRQPRHFLGIDSDDPGLHTRYWLQQLSSIGGGANLRLVAPGGSGEMRIDLQAGQARLWLPEVGNPIKLSLLPNEDHSPPMTMHPGPINTYSDFISRSALFYFPR